MDPGVLEVSIQVSCRCGLLASAEVDGSGGIKSWIPAFNWQLEMTVTYKHCTDSNFGGFFFSI